MQALTAAWQLRTVLVGLVALVAGSLVLPQALGLPTLSPQSLPTPATLIIAWFGSVIAAQAGFEPAWDVYATAGPRPRVVNLLRVITVGAVGAGISAFNLGNAAMSFTALAALLGVALISGAAFGHRLSWLAPTAYLLVIIGAGAANVIGTPRLWATPGNPTPGAAAFTLAAALLVSGVLAWWVSGSRQAEQQNRN